ncbi:endonuclease domain-containing protein [Paenibacillus macerans]|uniref:endonuclease domain-containing protein n=1 Tax=Paenibacillus macerans TaxID=44252 RepID=UPI00203D3997|nr:endonuclease domain-containing protein [Paenibacillus macerans]MCM3700037.1 endonuclease domain-containing protein [Paenibacillus macerans]
MEFEKAHQAFLEYHLSNRTGERKGRLLRGHQYAEKLLLQNVWWPLFGTLDNLHPEYEVYDWNRKSQFLDFAFLPAFGRFGLECDGFQSHVKDMDREKFSYSLNRDTFLTGMGWTMIHFSFDDMQQRPEVCRMLLQLVISPYLLRSGRDQGLPVREKEILRLAWRLGGRVRPRDVIQELDIDFRTARNRLRALSAKGMLGPIETGRGVRAYELRELALNYLY